MFLHDNDLKHTFDQANSESAPPAQNTTPVCLFKTTSIVADFEKGLSGKRRRKNKCPSIPMLKRVVVGKCKCAKFLYYPYKDDVRRLIRQMVMSHYISS